MKGIGRGNNPNSHVIAKYKRNGKGIPKLNRWQKEELITKAIRWALEHMKRTAIITQVQTNSPVRISYNDAIRIVEESEKQMQEWGSQDAETVINVHIGFYNDIMAYYQKVDNPAGVMKAMRQKEKLSGFAKKQKIQINEKKSTVIMKMPEYDFGRLNPQQQKRLQELSEKAGLAK